MSQQRVYRLAALALIVGSVVVSGRNLLASQGGARTASPAINRVQAHQQYREKMGIPAKLIVQASVAANFTVADPNNAGRLEMVGFGAAVPALVRDFAVN